MPRSQRCRQRTLIGAAPRHGDRLRAERLASIPRRRVIELNGQPGEQPRAHCGVAFAERCKRLLQQRDCVFIDGDDGDAEAGVSERRLGEHTGVAAVPGQRRGGVEGCSREVAIAGA